MLPVKLRVCIDSKGLHRSGRPFTMSRSLFWLSDEAWLAIEPYLPRNQPGARRVDDRRVISGILHVLKSGCRWCDCPADYGPSTTVYNRSEEHTSELQSLLRISYAVFCL